MAKKKSFLGKLFAVTTAVAAVSGVCYVFRDEIRASSLYKKLSGKLADLSADKDPEDEEDDFFFDDEDADFNSPFSEEAKNSREYTTITFNSNHEEGADEATTTDDETSVAEADSDAEDRTEDISSTDAEDTASVPEADETTADSIPTISFDTPSASTEPEEVTAYENEGLSDVSEDPDVLEEQDRLDF